MAIKESWKNKGYIDEPLQAGMDVRSEIEKLCKEKKAVILAHYYTQGEIQDVAHFVGDSLALARKAPSVWPSMSSLCLRVRRRALLRPFCRPGTACTAALCART